MKGVGSTNRATLRGGRDFSGGTSVAVSDADSALVDADECSGVTGEFMGEKAAVRGSIVKRAVRRFIVYLQIWVV